jgi:hypothetical protein
MDKPGPNSDVPLAVGPLSREQVGPFLILGVAKDADDATIEAAWAQRVLWARQGKTRTSLEDIHWARAILRDPEQRVAADAASLNPDVAGEELRRVARLWNVDGGRPAWPPIDPEPSAVGADVPDPEAVRATMPTPAVPIELPGVARWLDEFARTPIDPWGIAIPAEISQEPAHE